MPKITAAIVDKNGQNLVLFSLSCPNACPQFYIPILVLTLFDAHTKFGRRKFYW